MFYGANESLVSELLVHEYKIYISKIAVWNNYYE